MTHPIVGCARGWIGTRFHHQGRIKKTERHKGGVDCLGLLIGVADELKLRGKDGRLFASSDVTTYPHYPDTEKLYNTLASLLMPVVKTDLCAGDIVLLRIDGNPQHLAIVSDMDSGLGLIHAYAPARKVVEHVLDEWWKNRVEAVFRAD